jgi:hypothetical protein
MSEHDLLELVQNASQSIAIDLAQILTINFAMVVAIYYFLHQAGLRMRIFAFILYAMGMLALLLMMYADSVLRAGAIASMAALPEKSQAIVTQYYLAVSHSWVATLDTLFLNGAYWVLFIGIGYLLFFWKKSDQLDARG